jgi:hypothetical protein
MVKYRFNFLMKLQNNLLETLSILIDPNIQKNLYEKVEKEEIF